MMFLASNRLHNLRGQKWSCPCYHAKHLQQIHWSKLLCGMYGLTAKSSVPRLNICQLLMRLFWVANVWHCFIHLEVIFLRNFSSFSTSVLFYRGSRGRWIENKFWSKSASVLLCCLWKFRHLVLWPIRSVHLRRTFWCLQISQKVSTSQTHLHLETDT